MTLNYVVNIINEIAFVYFYEWIILSLTKRKAD